MYRTSLVVIQLSYRALDRRVNRRRWKRNRERGTSSREEGTIGLSRVDRELTCTGVLYQSSQGRIEVWTNVEWEVQWMKSLRALEREWREKNDIIWTEINA